MNRKQFYVKHQVHPDGGDITAKAVLKTIKSKLYIYIPFKVTHYIFDNNSLRKECGVFLIKEIANPLSIVSEFTLLNIRRKSGFNQLTLTVSKKDPNDNTKKIIKRAKLVFSKEYYTPDLATKIASFKTVNYEKDIAWTIEAITGPKEQFKLKVTDPIEEDDKKQEPEGSSSNKRIT